MVDKDSLIDNYCEVEFKESLDACTTSEERNALKERYVTYYKDGAGKDFIDSSVAKLKDYVEKASDSITELMTSAGKVMASNTIPAVITVGSASSTPNPAYFVIENSQKKNALLSLAKNVSGTLTLLLEAAMLIHWEIPNAVLTLIQEVTALFTLLNKIPG
mgnify:CR=1 FL=1